MVVTATDAANLNASTSFTWTVNTAACTGSGQKLTTGYLQRTVNVSGQAGRTATLKFAATENRALQTTFAIDDTALTVA